MLSPLPEGMLCACIFTCDSVLREHDGVHSAIRIVDLFYIPEPTAEVAASGIPLAKFHALAFIKVVPGYSRTHAIAISLINVSGEKILIGPREVLTTDFKSTVDPSLPGGIAIDLEVAVVVKRYGTAYVCLDIDGETVAQTPITLKSQPSEVIE